MGHREEQSDEKPKSSVEHKKKNHHPCIRSRPTACRSRHDMKQSESNSPESVHKVQSGVHPQCPSQETIIDEGRESMHIILIHNFSHTALNMGETTGQLRVPVATLTGQIEGDAYHV
jgi:hypothetical protein